MDLHTYTIIFILTISQISSTIIKIEEPRPGVIRGCGRTGSKFRCICHSIKERVSMEENTTLTNIKEIEILNCAHVVFRFNTVNEKSTLRQITLRNISNLIFEPRSIHRIVNRKKKLAVTIMDSYIDSIPSFSFKGISQLIFVNVTIGTVSPYAFYSTNNMYSIRFFGTKIDEIKSLAFQKLSTQYFIMNGCNFGSVSTNAFSNIAIKQGLFLTFSNVSNVKSDAFNLHYAKMLNVTNTNFYNVDKLPFRSRAASVLFQYVNFYKSRGEIFAGLRSLPEQMDELPKLTLRSMVFDCFSTKMLKINTNSFHADFEDIQFKRPYKTCM